MTRDQFAALLGKIQAEEEIVRQAGQAEYSHDLDNCFANFDSDSDHGVSRLQSIATHLNKHMRGIKAFVNGHRSQREDIRGRIKDARLYLALLWAAIEDEERQAEAAQQDFLEEMGWLYGADPLEAQRAPLYLTPQPLPVLPRAIAFRVQIAVWISKQQRPKGLTHGWSTEWHHRSTEGPNTKLSCIDRRKPRPA